MKFRNNLTGDIFDSLDELFDSLCNDKGCYFCLMARIGNKDKCKSWANANKDRFLCMASCKEVPDKSCYTCEYNKGNPICRLDLFQFTGCSNWKEQTE